jgi:hypothetical protein
VDPSQPHSPDLSVNVGFLALIEVPLLAHYCRVLSKLGKTSQEVTANGVRQRQGVFTLHGLVASPRCSS